MGATVKQEIATVVKDSGGFYSTPVTYMLDCGYRFSGLFTLSTVRQVIHCGEVLAGDPVLPGTLNSVDVARLSKGGEPDVYVTVATYETFQDNCLACCIEP